MIIRKTPQSLPLTNNPCLTYSRTVLNMNTVKQMARAILLASLVVIVIGCNKSREPGIVPVQGRVTLGAKPVSDATILFEHPEQGIALTAELDADGRYRLATYNRAGLPPGIYRVAITPGRIMQNWEDPLTGKVRPPAMPATKIPVRYHSTSSSGLRAEVIADSEKKLDFQLDP